MGQIFEFIEVCLLVMLMEGGMKCVCGVFYAKGPGLSWLELVTDSVDLL